MSAASILDLSAIPDAQRAAVQALLEEVAALKDITRRQEHLIAELNHAKDRRGPRAKRLDIVPVQLRVIVTVPPRYACRFCTDGVTQAPAPSRLITGGLPTEATLAHVLVSKYADHLPSYRQSQIRAGGP